MPNGRNGTIQRGVAPTNPLAYGVARNNNRTNTQGAAPTSPLTRATLSVANVIPAGGHLAVPCQGNQFYVSASSAPINVRPAGGVYVQYATGTGLGIPLENAFDRLDIENPNAFAIAFQIIYGFDNFIDKRLIVSQQEQPIVTYPTYPVANAAAVVNITDRSGQEFQDINGNSWFALYRVAIEIANTDTGVTLLLQKADSVVAGGPAISAIFPETILYEQTSGDYRLHLG